MCTERLSPTIEEFQAGIANREVLLCHGPSIVEFGLAYLQRDENTGKLTTISDKPVTPEIAQTYIEAFSTIKNTPALRFLARDATGFSWGELNEFSDYLNSIAKPIKA